MTTPTNEGPDRRTHRPSLEITPDDANEMGEQFLRIAVEQYSDVRSFPIFPATVDLALIKEFDQAIPIDGISLEKLLEECGRIVTGCRQNGHPRFFGYVASPATFPGICAD